MAEKPLTDKGVSVNLAQLESKQLFILPISKSS